MLFSMSVHSQSNTEKTIELLTDALKEAMINPDESVLDSLMSSELSYGHSGGLVENKEEIIYGLTKGPFHFLTIGISNQTIKIIEDISIVRHTFTCDYLNKEERGTLNFSVLLIWHLENGKWKLLARQAAKL